jgi:hypothetical protein
MTRHAPSLDWRQRIAVLALGHTVNKLVFDWPFNYLLYPWVIYTLGVFHGGLVMTALSLLICLLTIRFYDWSKRDWLGLELVKDLKGYEGSNAVGRVASWFLRRGDIPTFFYLTIQHDPFITMVYLRKGSFNGMSRRDWRIFIASLIMGNTYWILACWMGISLVEWAWKAVTG